MISKQMVQTFVAQFVERPDIDYYDSVVVDLPNLLDDASFQVFAQIHAKGKRHFGLVRFWAERKQQGKFKSEESRNCQFWWLDRIFRMTSKSWWLILLIFPLVKSC